MENHNISEKKLFTILSIDLFSMTGLILPAVIARFAGENGMVALLLASGFALLSGCYYLWITNNGEFGWNYVVKNSPTFLRYFITAIYCVRFFFHGAFLISVFAALIQENLLPEQKRLWILLPFLLLAFLASGKSISVRGSILEVLFPYIFVPLLVVLVLALFRVDYNEMGNYVFRESTVGEIFWPAYRIFAFYQPMEFLLFLSPLRKTEAKKKGRAVTYASLFVIVINILMNIVTVSMFGMVRTADKLWSSLYIMQSVRLPGHFVERLDILFLVFYIFSTFALFSGYLFYSETLLAVKKEGWAKKVYPILFLAGTLILALMNEDVESTFLLFLRYKIWIDVPLAFVLPLVVRLFASRERKKGKSIMAVLLCLVSFLGLTGCQNKVDIEDRNYIMVLGVEKGAKEDYKMTYEIADLSESTGEGGASAGKGREMVYEADSLENAEEKSEKSDDKRMDYGHLKALVFEKSLMEDAGSFHTFVEELESKRGLAGTTLVFFSEESPKQYMELAKDMGTTLGEYLERMMANHKKDERMEYTLSELLKEEAEGALERVVPMLTIKEDKIYLVEKSVKKEETDLSSQVLRFHIRANSDSEKDQQMKVRIKNQILPYLQSLFANSSSKGECMTIAKNNLKEIKETVSKACEAEGAGDMKLSVYLCRESFPLKQYGNMIFPSGVYDALRIDLGEGEGANWWCMMYPSLCMTDGVVEGVTQEAQEELQESLDEESYDSLFFQTKENKFHIKWRISEIFQKFFGEKSP